MTKPPTFIEKHGLWSDDERRLAADIKRRVEAEKLRYRPARLERHPRLCARQNADRSGVPVGA